MAAVVVVAAVGAVVVENEVAVTTGRFLSFSANPWVLKARPFTLGFLYTS
jgi:hypothetical protein